MTLHIETQGEGFRISIILYYYYYYYLFGLFGTAASVCNSSRYTRDAIVSEAVRCTTRQFWEEKQRKKVRECTSPSFHSFISDWARKMISELGRE